jgi:hypothetical protein
MSFRNKKSESVKHSKWTLNGKTLYGGDPQRMANPSKTPALPVDFLHKVRIPRAASESNNSALKEDHGLDPSIV